MAAQCPIWRSLFLFRYCTPDNENLHQTFTYEWTRKSMHDISPIPAVEQDLARFLLVRGPYAWIGWQWVGCHNRCILTLPTVPCVCVRVRACACACVFALGGRAQQQWCKPHCTPQPKEIDPPSCRVPFLLFLPFLPFLPFRCGSYERPPELEHDYGTPVDRVCREVDGSPGVYERAWTSGVVRMDCNTWSATLPPPL